MSDLYTIQLEKIAGSSVLAGAAAGVAAQKNIVAELVGRPPKICALECGGVEFATASFVREAVFGTRDALRRAGVSTQLVLVNAESVVQEEILLVARALGSSVVHALMSSRGIAKPTLLGELDEAQRETLDLVLRLGEATASDLAAEKPSVKPTAWNNRLTALVGRGVLTEGRRERHKVYRPVVKGLSYGS
ncbi:MAG: hypothetical protein KDA16_00345 [Phycisphaerales bacterium]|nr:hypothetical protein [Phycisphaerales bacterium]